jgi:F0F1-type ATP synthase assembly protein I
MIMERGARPDALPDAHARHITPLIVAALVGAVLGIAAGYSVQLGWFIMIIWALVGAGVVGGAVYGYRIFR